MSHRSILLSVLVGCSSGPEWLGAAGRGELTNADAPNVLVISLDTLRSDRLPLYGHGRNTAPTLSAIAAEGGWMSRTWSHAPQTDGTHAALFTGRYSSTHGKFTHEQRLPSSEQTFAEHFRAHGYRTWAVATSLKFVRESGFSQGFEDWMLHGEGAVVARGNQALADALDQMAGGGPWLGFVHLFDVHAPYTPPEPHRSQFLTAAPTIKPRRTVHYIRKHRRDKNIPPNKLRTLRELYEGGIHHVDARVAELWDVARTSQRETVMVITSDHGEAFSEHDYLGHSNFLWEEIMRVPWIVWAPGRVAPGTRIDAPAQSVDLAPTLTDLAGLDPLPAVDGESFGPALLGTGPAPSEERLIALQETGRWGVVRTIDGITWKLTTAVHERKRAQLVAGEATRLTDVRMFNLTDDPHERADVAEDHPRIRTALEADLRALGSDDPTARSVQRDDISDEELEGLRAIGYVD
ncbi:MAG: sulfatase-like hydrolase/transferase [Myxococcota bacterium]|nr:sulfatase-like hydrolase/transferase [Myxococcota bacterium]